MSLSQGFIEHGNIGNFFRGNKRYFKMIFIEQENSELDCRDQGDTNLLSVTISFNFFNPLPYNKIK